MIFLFLLVSTPIAVFLAHPFFGWRWMAGYYLMGVEVLAVFSQLVHVPLSLTQWLMPPLPLLAALVCYAVWNILLTVKRFGRRERLWVCGGLVLAVVFIWPVAVWQYVSVIAPIQTSDLSRLLVATRFWPMKGTGLFVIGLQIWHWVNLARSPSRLLG